MRTYLGIATAALWLATGCKPFHANEVGAELKSDDDSRANLEPARDLATGQPVADEAAAFRDLEVVDCPPEICTADTELIAATPEGANAAAAGELALAGEASPSIDDVTASNNSLAQALSNGSIDGLRAISSLVTIGNAVSQFDGKTPREKVDSAKVVLRALSDLDRAAGADVRRSLQAGRADLSRFRPLKQALERFSDASSDAEAKRLLSTAEAALSFFRDNLVSSTYDGKIKILEALLDAIPAELLDEGEGSSQPNSLANLGDAKTIALVSAAKRFAGKDGFLNRGDSVRILPVVPKLVAEVADQKIAEGMAQGIAQLASEHPFVYRRWMRRPNGLIGRAVDKGIGNALSQAEAAKWNAVRQAGAATQKMFDDVMSDFGVSHYYLGLEADTDHWDPDAELTTWEIRELVKNLTGMTVDQIAAKAISGGGLNANSAQANAAKIKQMVGKLSFPDGLPVDEVVTLLNAYRTNGEVKIPSGVDFRMGDAGKVEVVRHHDRCECYFEPQVKACIMTFKPTGDATLRYYPSNVPSQGTCDLQTQCNANFQQGGRTVNLKKACGGAFRDRATGNVYVYRK